MLRKLLLLLALALPVSGCGSTQPVPVTPRPCDILPFPIPPDVTGVSETGAEALLGVWMQDLADWRDSVRSCQWVHELPSYPTLDAGVATCGTSTDGPCPIPSVHEVFEEIPRGFSPR